VVFLYLYNKLYIIIMIILYSYLNKNVIKIQRCAMKTIQRTITILSVILMILSSSFTVSIRTSSIKANVNEDNNVKLNGSILVEITDEYLGAAFPLINLSSNDVFKFNVTSINRDTYQVNYTLRIDIEVLGNFNNSYAFGRYLTTLVLISRENRGSEESNILYRDLILNRLIWVIDRFNLVSAGEKFIEIPLQYVTNLSSENVTIHIFTLGSLTGFLAKGKLVFDHKIVNLKILHNLPIVDQYLLTVSTAGTGTGTVAFTPAGSYNPGDLVTVWANASVGSTFVGWGGDLSGTNSPETLIMDGNKTVTAEFTQNQYLLTTNSEGSGSVTKDPDQVTYGYGSDVVLTAVVDPGWTFDHWSGDLSGSLNPTTITIDSNKIVTAVFTQDQYSLNINNDGDGSVTKNPNQSTYTYGTPVELIAIADLGWSFDHWSGDLTGNDNPETITMNSNKIVTAHFILCEYTLTVNIDGDGTVTKNPDQPTYTYGTIVELMANPGIGWIFDHWSGGLSGSINPATITIDSDKFVTANFSLIDTIPPVTEILIEEI